jgi:2-succinyl-6-hydroxy-2,4-cyclohexadiene-1-carboxylate synthase
MANGSSIRFHYRRQGAKADPTLLLLHGFMGSADDWTGEITEPLVAAGLQVLAVDLPGHGRTIVDDEDDYYIEYCAPALVRLLDDLRLKRVHLLGYSMGGRLALYMAVRFPERFQRIVLESASPGLKTKAERKARIAEDAALAMRMLSQPMVEFLIEWYTQPLFSSMSTQPARLERLIARRIDNDALGLSMSLKGMGAGAQPSLWNELANVESSLLLIAGEKDSKFCGVGREMVKRSPKATLAVVADSGHNVHFERPREFTELVREFLHD